MTPEQFAALQPGDVLRFRRKNGTYYLRTVITAPNCPKGGIHLAIMRRSWTGRMLAAALPSQLKDQGDAVNGNLMARLLRQLAEHVEGNKGNIG